jgi:hypothetical protein
MSQLINEIQYRLKTSSQSVVVMVVRIFIGLVLGLTVALIAQTIMQFGNFSFFLILVVVTAIFNKLTKAWKFGGLVGFSIFCILLGTVLRMYIMIAPGA